MAYTAGLAVSMCVTLQRAAWEVSGKCYQNIANMNSIFIVARAVVDALYNDFFCEFWVAAAMH